MQICFPHFLHAQSLFFWDCFSHCVHIPFKIWNVARDCVHWTPSITCVTVMSARIYTLLTHESVECEDLVESMALCLSACTSYHQPFDWYSMEQIQAMGQMLSWIYCIQLLANIYIYDLWRNLHPNSHRTSWLTAELTSTTHSNAFKLSLGVSNSQPLTCEWASYHFSDVDTSASTTNQHVGLDSHRKNQNTFIGEQLALLWRILLKRTKVGYLESAINGRVIDDKQKFTHIVSASRRRRLKTGCMYG